MSRIVADSWRCPAWRAKEAMGAREPSTGEPSPERSIGASASPGSGRAAVRPADVEAVPPSLLPAFAAPAEPGTSAPAAG